MMQDYIENENGRLEREQQFWSKEIVVKIEYKYCPNLTIIDTPGGHVDHKACQSELVDLQSILLPQLCNLGLVSCMAVPRSFTGCYRTS